MEVEEKEKNKSLKYKPGNRLPTMRYRWFIELIFNEGLSIRESCKEIGISYGTGKRIVGEVRRVWMRDGKHDRAGWRGEYKLYEFR